MRRSNKRGMMISLFVIIISIFNFERLSNSECIRTIHVVTLLVCGMAIGIFLMNLFGLLSTRRN
ncbi:MAG TPA: hypothetical protein VFU62_05945 [Hanamia sp.]|nr:hypothetical protein [Hanamia sp.]